MKSKIEVGMHYSTIDGQNVKVLEKLNSNVFYCHVAGKSYAYNEKGKFIGFEDTPYYKMHIDFEDAFNWKDVKKGMAFKLKYEDNKLFWFLTKDPTNKSYGIFIKCKEDLVGKDLIVVNLIHFTFVTRVPEHDQNWSE